MRRSMNKVLGKALRCAKRSTRRKQRKEHQRQLEERQKKLDYARTIGYDPYINGKLGSISVNQWIKSYDEYLEDQWISEYAPSHMV